MVLEATVENLSRFQNEENIALAIVGTEGTKIVMSKSGFENRLIDNDRMVHIHNATPILHYSLPLVFTFVVEVDLNKVGNLSGITLYLQFGGKYSPMKYSRYFVSLPMMFDENIPFSMSSEENKTRL